MQSVPEDEQIAPQRLAAIRLALVPGVGPRTRQSLLAAFGSPQSVLRASRPQLAAVQGVGEELSRRIASAEQEIDVLSEFELCRKQNIKIVCEGDADYPRLLREICDPPGILFVRGELRPVDGLSLAIVGSRRATSYGIGQAKRLGADLARAGFTVVSGLARGADGAAHRGALAAQGRTIAVLGSGVLNIYPPEHAALAGEVAAQGALISEAPPRRRPLSGAFPQRNRVITGMSLGVVVVEAAERSGALISARHAMEQGREVFAVPGRVDSRLSRGCHQLLRDGAKLVESIEDILEELGPLVEAVPDAQEQAIYHPAELRLNALERAVLAEIDTRPTNIDDIVAQTGLAIQKILSAISVLEMSHLIRRVSGNQVVRRA